MRSIGGAPYGEASRSVLAHCQAHSAPVVLITGYQGSEKTKLIREAVQAEDLMLHEARAEQMPGRLLLRRLRVLTAEGERTVHQAADLIRESSRGGLQDTGHVLVQNIDLLDDDSLQVLDLLVRSRQTGLYMTASAPSQLSYRYARILSSSRGLHVPLGSPSDEELHRRLEERLEAPPASGLRDYLIRCSAGVPRTLDRAVQVGQEEGWIGTLGSRSVMMRPPIWMDHHHAVSFRDEVREALGEEALRLLGTVAVAEPYPLPELLASADEGVFVLEEAGLFSIEGGRVRIARPAHRHLLIRGMVQDDVRGVPTPEKALVARLAGAAIDSSTAWHAAEALLGRGLIEQARFIAAALPPDDPRGAQIEASANVLTGAPRRALHDLWQGGPAEAAEAGEDVMLGLTGFLEGVLLRRPTLAAAQCDLFGEIAGQLDMFETHRAETYLSLVPESISEQRWAKYMESRGGRRGETSQAGVPDLPLLALAVGLALEAYAAAVADHRQRAQTVIDRFVRLPAASIPAIGMDWACGHIGLARILISPGDDLLAPEGIVPEGNVAEAPERTLLRTTSSETILLFHALVRGERIDVLRDRLDDIWAQFEGGLARGQVTRRLLEAFDFVVEGDRSEELFGPARMLMPQLTEPFRDPWVNVLLLLGQLLHCPPEELPEDLETLFVGRADSGGVRRLIVRATILRRAAELPRQLLGSLVSMGERSGVEPEVLAYASELVAESEQEVVSEASDRLRQSYPSFHVTGTGEKDAGTAAPMLRTDRLKLLSRREQEIAERIIAGNTAVQAADLFGISVRTVQTHVRNVYRKLAVGSRTELRAELLPGLGVRP